MPHGERNGSRELALFERFCSELIVQQRRPLKLEPFQRLMLRDYFAGTRETLVLISKKNGKTTLLSALALFHLCTTPEAECVLAASSRDQASILYDQADGFIDRSAWLQARAIAKRGYREIRSTRDKGRIRVLAADVDHADGVIPTLVLVDELGRHRSAELYGVFRDGLGPRGGQMIAISVAGDHEGSPLGVMRSAARHLDHITVKGRHTYARSADGSYVMHEWALTPDDDPDHMPTVKMANPASWQTLDLLAERHASPSTLPWQWARFACGLWVSEEAWWMKGDEWRAAAVEARFAPGDKIAIGFDGSRFGDATALVGCRLTDGLVQPLGVWEPSEGSEVDAGAVDARLAEVMSTYKVVRGYFDPPLWQTEIDGWAAEYGDTAVMRFHTNRSRMHAAVERFRTDLAAGKVPHTGDPVLTTHVLNAQMRETRGGYVLTKTRAGSPDKIDAGVAAVLANEARADALAAGDDREKAPARLITF